MDEVNELKRKIKELQGQDDKKSSEELIKLCRELGKILIESNIKNKGI